MSDIAAVIEVERLWPAGIAFAVGVNTNPSSAAVTAAAEPLTVYVPLLTMPPSAAALGSDKMPLLTLLSVTTALSVCDAFGSLTASPAKGSPLAVKAIATGETGVRVIGDGDAGPKYFAHAAASNGLSSEAFENS